MGPTVEAIVVCDGFHRDPGTGKYSLLGTFNTVFTVRAPAPYPAPRSTATTGTAQPTPKR